MKFASTWSAQSMKLCWYFLKRCRFPFDFRSVWIHLYNDNLRLSSRAYYFLFLTVINYTKRKVIHVLSHLQMIVFQTGTSSPETLTTTFNFTVDATPTISSVSPMTGASGDVITITGTGFGSVDNDVMVRLKYSFTRTHFYCLSSFGFKISNYLIANVSGKFAKVYWLWVQSFEFISSTFVHLQ